MKNSERNLKGCPECGIDLEYNESKPDYDLYRCPNVDCDWDKDLIVKR